MSSSSFFRVARTASLQSGRRTLASPLIYSTTCAPTIPQHPLHQQQHYRHKHTVRVILTKDLPEGQKRGIYAGEVHHVSAGYARNYLVPKQMAVYATPRNFERCGLVDPELMEKEEQAKLSKFEDEEEDDEDLKAADLLRRYLRNKMVRIRRNVDHNVPTVCHPGHVSAKNVRDNLSKQLKIDLEPHETIHMSEETVYGLDELDEKEIASLIAKMYGDASGGVAVKKEDGGDDEGELNVEEEKSDDEVVESVTTVEGGDVGEDSNETKECTVKIKQLGEYLAKIELAGGYVVPLRFLVEKR